MSVVVVSLINLSTENVIVDEIIKISYLFNIKSNHQSCKKFFSLLKLNNKF